jgi:hypothetical protein
MPTETRQNKIPEWVPNFSVTFLSAVTVFSVRRLYTMNQPIWGMLVEAAVLAAGYALFAPLLTGKNRSN